MNFFAGFTLFGRALILFVFDANSAAILGFCENKYFACFLETNGLMVI